MTRREVITPRAVHQPASPCSHAVITAPGRHVFVSGQVPVEPSGRLVSEEDFDAHFPDGGFPASTLIVVAGLAAPSWLVEIEAYAVPPE